MSTEQENALEPALEPASKPAPDPMEDTDRIQKAIEKVVDEETAALPPLPLSGIPDAPEESEEPVTPYRSEVQISDAGSSAPSRKYSEDAQVHAWFFTFMCMNIPIGGWIYLLYLAFSKKRTDRRSFARAYLFYKLIFLLVSVLILGILIYIGLGYLDQLLAYMEML